MRLLTCAADDCNETFQFDPQNPLKKFHSIQCQTRMRLRRWRKSKRVGPDGGGGKRRQLALFSKQSVSAKRAKPARPETAPLFTMQANGKHEKHAPLLPGELCAIPVIGHCEDAEQQLPDSPVTSPKPVQSARPDLGGLDAAA
jgi:hypothetical protein